MRKILYILTKGPAQEPGPLLPSPASPEKGVSILLIQDAVGLTDLPQSQVYALADDVRSRNLKSSFPTVSYHEMLTMIFDADTVVAL